MLLEHKDLITELSKREVAKRFKGSVFGRSWVILLPLLMLAVYSFVFTVVFDARFGVRSDTEAGVSPALMIFSGIILHAFAADILMRAPQLMNDNKNFVKKVIFPLEILPLVLSFGAAIQLAVSSIILLLGIGIFHELSITMLFAPILLIPFIAFWCGIAWILSSISVFFNDISQLTSVLAMMLLFLSPVFYSVDILPPMLQTIFMLNPLSWVITAFRDCMILGKMPNFFEFILYSFVCGTIYLLGKRLFQKMKNGFADIV